VQLISPSGLQGFKVPRRASRRAGSSITLFLIFFEKWFDVGLWISSQSEGFGGVYGAGDGDVHPPPTSANNGTWRVVWQISFDQVHESRTADCFGQKLVVFATFWPKQSTQANCALKLLSTHLVLYLTGELL
jgi:hypothetical protein